MGVPGRSRELNPVVGAVMRALFLTGLILVAVLYSFVLCTVIWTVW